MMHTDAPRDLDAERADDRTPTLFIARHGEVDARWRGTVYGRLDVALSERGREQSALLAAALQGVELAFVVSSGLERAEVAAGLVRAGRSALGPEIDPRFVELDRGEWAGRTLDDLRREEPDAFERWAAQAGAVQAPGGESPAAVQARTLPAFTDWARRAAAAPERAGLIVAHLWVVRSAVAHALGMPMERSGALRLPPGGLVELRWPLEAAGRPELVRFGA